MSYLPFAVFPNSLFMREALRLVVNLSKNRNHLSHKTEKPWECALALAVVSDRLKLKPVNNGTTNVTGVISCLSLPFNTSKMTRWRVGTKVSGVIPKPEYDASIAAAQWSRAAVNGKSGSFDCCLWCRVVLREDVFVDESNWYLYHWDVYLIGVVSNDEFAAAVALNNDQAGFRPCGSKDPKAPRAKSPYHVDTYSIEYSLCHDIPDFVVSPVRHRICRI